MTLINRLRWAIAPITISVALASTLGLAAWYLLPYEALEQRTPEEQFVLWESIMWMVGLALSFFGAAAFFGSSDMYGHAGDPYLNRSADHIRIQVQQGVRGRMLFTDLPSVPWFMIGTGTAVLVLTVVTRSLTA